MNCKADDLVSTERVGLIAWALAKGEQLTTRQIADKVGIGYAGAWILMQKLCRVLPITFDESLYEGVWYSMEHHKIQAQSTDC